MRRSLASFACMAVLLAPVRHASASPLTPHMRALDPCAASIMSQGLQRSETIRQLGDRLATSDVVAYVRCVWPSSTDLQQGSLVWVSATLSLRYVLIRLAHGLTPARRIEMLGHEMQHANEVALAPWVRDETSMGRLFEEIGRRTSSRGTFETWNAQAMERAVREDLASAPPPPLPDDTVLADADRPASGVSGSALAQAGQVAPGDSHQREARVGVLPQIQDRLIALQTPFALTQRGVRPGLTQQGQWVKD